MEQTPEPIVVTPERAVVRLGPVGTYLRARDFLAVADLARKTDKRFSPVASFLYCRSIELCLKAYLVSRGTTFAELKAMGHDLGRLLIDAFGARGLDLIAPLTPEEREAVLRANELYQSNKLAYFDLFSGVSDPVDHPGDALLAVIAAKLLTATERGCFAASTQV